MFERQEGAEHIDVQHPDKLVDALDVVRAGHAAAAGIGDETVQGTGGFAGRRDQALHILFLGRVGQYIVDAAAVAGRGADRFRGIGQPVLGSAADRDRRAIRRQARRAGPANAGAAAGDDEGETFQPTGWDRARNHNPSPR